MAGPPANVPGFLNSSPGGATGNCDAPGTSSATTCSSSEHKAHDAPLCDMTKSVPDPSSINVSDGQLTDYIYNLKLYPKDNINNVILVIWLSISFEINLKLLNIFYMTAW